MATLKQCDICGNTIKHQPDLPDHWTSLSRFSLDNDHIDCGQIDICNACRSEIAEFYYGISSGIATVNNDYYTRLAITSKMLRFVLGIEKGDLDSE